METPRSQPCIAAAAGALLVLVIGWLGTASLPLVSEAETAERQSVSNLLSKLEEECDPDSPSNDYLWSSNAPPTERRRREILEKLHPLRETAASEVRVRLQIRKNNEFGEMLVVLAAAFGDESLRVPAAKLMAYSEHPAVRLCAARELRRLRDPRLVEWFEFAARNDDRFVRNDGCGRTFELYYPVRTVAELALQEIGAPIQSTH